MFPSSFDFSFVELKKKQQIVFKFKSKNLFEPCDFWPDLIFITLSGLISKSFFKIKYFLGNQIEATKEEGKVLVAIRFKSSVRYIGDGLGVKTLLVFGSSPEVAGYCKTRMADST